MRDLGNCFGENSISISNTSCSSNSSENCSSVRYCVSCFYEGVLSGSRQFILKVSWSRVQGSQGLTVHVGIDPSSPSFKLNTNSGFFRKKKGSKFLEAEGTKFEIFYDFSNAKYDSGPEPVSGFSVIVLAESEIVLSLGDRVDESISRKVKQSPMSEVKVCPIARHEHCVGSKIYATKVKFSDAGSQHEILIKCSDDKVLFVSVDKKTVISVQSLHWNFRGNETIFVDGLLVDLFWDVHDWLFSSSKGCAVFMFRTRNGDSRLWLEEKKAKKGHQSPDFSLLIYAFKAP